MPAFVSSATREGPGPSIPFHPRVFRIGDLDARAESAWSSGFANLDCELPGGGWPRAGLIDIACDAWGIGELSLVLPGLAAGLRSRDKQGLWILPPGNTHHVPWVPYAPSLASQGLALDQLVFVRPPSAEEGLWCAEQALRSGTVAHVLLWLEDQRLASLALRRLQQAAMAGGANVFVFRSLASLGSPSPASLRLALGTAAQGMLRVELVKRRGLPDGHTLLLAPRQLPCLERTPVPQGSVLPWKNAPQPRALFG